MRRVTHPYPSNHPMFFVRLFSPRHHPTIVCALVGCVTATLATAQVPPGYTVGTPWSGPLGVRERVSRLMEDEDNASRELRPKHVHPRPRMDFPNQQGNPVSPDVASYPAMPPGTLPSPLN